MPKPKFKNEPLAVTRYGLSPVDDGASAIPFTGEILKGLQACPFKEIQVPSEEASSGFTVYGEPLAIDFTWQNIQISDFVVFGLRKDKRSFSARLFKIEFQRLIKEELARIEREIDRETQLPGVDGQKREGKIPASRLKEMKKSLKARLLADAAPVPSTADVVWDVQDRRLYLFSTAGAMRKELATLFALYLGNLARIQELQPLNLLMDHGLEIPENPAPVGMEFLTSLLVAARSVESGRVPLYPDEESSPVFTLRYELHLEGKEDGRSQIGAFKGDVIDGAEVAAALKAGRMVTKASLAFYEGAEGETASLATVAAGDFAFTDVLLPLTPPDEETAPEAVFLERMHLLKKTLGYVEGCFLNFVSRYELNVVCVRCAAALRSPSAEDDEEQPQEEKDVLGTLNELYAAHGEGMSKVEFLSQLRDAMFLRKIMSAVNDGGAVTVESGGKILRLDTAKAANA